MLNVRCGPNDRFVDAQHHCVGRAGCFTQPCRSTNALRGGTNRRQQEEQTHRQAKPSQATKACAPCGERTGGDYEGDAPARMRGGGEATGRDRGSHQLDKRGRAEGDVTLVLGRKLLHSCIGTRRWTLLPKQSTARHWSGEDHHLRCGRGRQQEDGRRHTGRFRTA